MLDPKNLLYFNRIIFESKLVEDAEIAQFAKSMFELTLAYALVFRTQNDFNLCHEFLKQALLNLDMIKSNLVHMMTDDETLLNEIFGCKLLQFLAANLDLSAEKLSAR